MAENYQKRPLCAGEHYIIKQIQLSKSDYPEELNSLLNQGEKKARMFGTMVFGLCGEREMLKTSKNHHVLPDYLHGFLSLGFDESKTCAFLGFESQFKRYCDLQDLGLVGALRDESRNGYFLGLQLKKIYNGTSYVGEHRFAIKIEHPELVRLLKGADELVLLELLDGEIISMSNPVPLSDIARNQEQRFKQQQKRGKWQQKNKGSQPSFQAQMGYKKPSFGKR